MEMNEGFKALADRLEMQAKEIAAAGHNGWGNTMMEAAAALTSPQADKARGEDSVRLNSDDSLDEIVGNGPYHLEQMSSEHWSLRLGRHLIGFHAKRAIKTSFIENDLPATTPQPQGDANPYEVLCVECGQPTMHIGNVCYACSHPQQAAPQAPPDMEGLDFEPDEQHAVADMANVGYSLMQAIARNCPDYAWNESPAEIVCDLINERDEARQARPDGGALTCWLAVGPEGCISFGMDCNDANNGEAARSEVNDWINDRLQLDGEAHRLIGVYTHPAPAPDVARLVEAILDHPYGDTTLGNIVCAEISGERLRPALIEALTAAQQGATNGQE